MPPKLMNIRTATTSYETWLQQYISLVPDGLDQKHAKMAQDPFLFFRGTFYRWTQIFNSLVPDVAMAPTLLAVGDLHIENFGTWRDREGRLIWGVNDFDEAAYLPYTNDLIRLTASAQLAGEEKNHFRLSGDVASEAILHGYTAGLVTPSEPFVLEENNADLRKMAISVLRDPAHFWQKMQALTDVDKARIPADALYALADSLPPSSAPVIYKTRVAGMGSLGHPRFVAMTHVDGGAVARETKPLTPSAVAWANDIHKPSLYKSLVSSAIRARDPFLLFYNDAWLVRRLAPFGTRIDLTGLDEVESQTDLLFAMGAETANIHQGSLSSEGIAEVRADLARRARHDTNWLSSASETLTKAIRSDYKDWRAD